MVKVEWPKTSLLSWTYFNNVMQNTMNNDEGQVMWEIKIFIVGLDTILFSSLNAILSEFNSVYGFYHVLKHHSYFTWPGLIRHMNAPLLTLSRFILRV